MESYEEDDVVGESQDSPPRRTRSGRPVVGKRGRGRKKAAVPRATRATRNTRAKQSAEEDEDDSASHEEEFSGLLDLESEAITESDGLEAIQAVLNEPLEPAYGSDAGGMMEEFLIDDSNPGDAANGDNVLEEETFTVEDDDEEEAENGSPEVQEIVDEGEEQSGQEAGSNSEEEAEPDKASESEVEEVEEVETMEVDDVPELAESPPSSVAAQVQSGSSTLRLNSLGADESNSEDVSLAAVRLAAEGSVLDAANGWPSSEEGVAESREPITEPDTEMVSEDELPVEAKEPLDTEAVSDEELPDPARPADHLPETEEVSEEELPPEKSYQKKKKKSAKVSAKEDKTAGSGEAGAGGAEGGGAGTGKKKRKLLEGDSYDPNSPTSENSDETPAAKKPALAADAADAAAEADKDKDKDKKKTLPELEKYWTAVREDPADFTGWTYLLQYVDQENDIEAAREAYDGFLSHYSYCYGYWRKYADYEKRKDNKAKCEEVFDRGLKAIPLSVDLWLHYLNHCKAATPDDEEALRAHFERALAACGLEFRSDRLWESYIKWELDNKRLPLAMALYDRLLATPTQAYVTHFESLQTLVNGNPPAKLLSVDEFLEERREVLQRIKAAEQPTPVADASAPPGDEEAAPPGEESQEAVLASSADETAALRERIIASRRKVHKATATLVADRWVFEEGIKRPYFHVKPLERCQLKNWREYLEFEIARGDHARITVLFERCLIACALYDDMWQKFLRYLDSKGEVERMRDVYQRACTIHHPKKPSLHLAWAVFEETQHAFDKASEILSALDESVPGLLQVAYRRINLERRQGKLDAAAELYQHYIGAAKSKLVANNMAIKFARFCCKVKNDVDLAIQVLTKAIDKDKDNPRLYLQLVDLSLQKSPLSEAEVVRVLDQFLQSKDSDAEQKVLFAQRKVEFLEDFGASVASVQKAQEEFQKFCKQSKDKKKKAAEESKSEAKKAKASGGGEAAVSSPNGVAPTAPAAAGQYAAGYAPGYPAGAAAAGYQGQYPAGGQQPYGQYPAGGQYPGGQADPSYTGYQNWGYSQPGYGGYNQGWTGNYNYY